MAALAWWGWQTGADDASRAIIAIGAAGLLVVIWAWSWRQGAQPARATGPLAGRQRAAAARGSRAVGGGRDHGRRPAGHPCHHRHCRAPGIGPGRRAGSHELTRRTTTAATGGPVRPPRAPMPPPGAGAPPQPLPTDRCAPRERRCRLRAGAPPQPLRADRWTPAVADAAPRRRRTTTAATGGPLRPPRAPMPPPGAGAPPQPLPADRCAPRGRRCRLPAPAHHHSRYRRTVSVSAPRPFLGLDVDELTEGTPRCLGHLTISLSAPARSGATVPGTRTRRNRRAPRATPQPRAAPSRARPDERAGGRAVPHDRRSPRPFRGHAADLLRQLHRRRPVERPELRDRLAHAGTGEHRRARAGRPAPAPARLLVPGPAPDRYLGGPWAGTASAPVTIDAYGTGSRPKVRDAAPTSSSPAGTSSSPTCGPAPPRPPTTTSARTRRVASPTAGGCVPVPITSPSSARGRSACTSRCGSSDGSHHDRIIGNDFVDNDVKDPNPASGCRSGRGRDPRRRQRGRLEPHRGQRLVLAAVWPRRRRGRHLRRTAQRDPPQRGGGQQRVPGGRPEPADRQDRPGHDDRLQRGARVAATATFLVVRGAGSKYGPHAGHVVRHNRVYLTGAESYALQCTNGCTPDILDFRDNIVWAQDRVGFVDGIVERGPQHLVEPDPSQPVVHHRQQLVPRRSPIRGWPPRRPATAVDQSCGRRRRHAPRAAGWPAGPGQAGRPPGQAARHRSLRAPAVR